MLSEKPWNRELLLLLMAGLLICWSVGMLLGILLEQILPLDAMAQKSFYHFVIGTLSFHAAAIFLVHHFLKLNGTNWREFLGLSGPHLKRIIIFAILIGILSLPLVWLLQKWSIDLMNLVKVESTPQPAIKVLESTVDSRQQLFFGLVAIILVPVAEESLFRGILYPFIKQRGYPRFAFWGTSTLFAAIHFNVVVFLPLTFFAIILLLVYEKTDKLVAPILMHSLFNLVNFLGAIFGPELGRFFHHFLQRH